MRVNKLTDAADDVPTPERFGQATKNVLKQVSESGPKNPKYGHKSSQLAFKGESSKQANYMIFYTINFSDP